MITWASITFILLPVFLILLAGLFLFVYLLKRNIGIYLGWLAMTPFIVLAITDDVSWLWLLLPVFIVYVVAAVLRFDKNKKEKEKEEQKQREMDKMSIDDL